MQRQAAIAEGGVNVAALTELVERIEKLDAPDFQLDLDIARAVHGDYGPRPPYTDSLDAVIDMLPEGSDWRRFTPRSCSIYAASPYNAKAEVRHDGYGPTPAAQLCAAYFKMLLAKAKQMEKSA